MQERLTVQEYAAAAGVSVQSVYKQRKRPGSALAPYFVEDAGKLYILAEALERQEAPKPTEEEEPPRRSRTDTIAMLRGQIAEKDRLLAAQAQQIAAQQELLAGLQRSVEQLTASLQATTESLQTAQALHAGTIQQQLDAPDQAGRRGFFARFFSGKK